MCVSLKSMWLASALRSYTLALRSTNQRHLLLTFLSGHGTLAISRDSVRTASFLEQYRWTLESRREEREAKASD